MKTVITHADRNGDGRVTRSEFVDGPAPLFDRADRDHDGRLSRDEIAAARDQFEALK
ncbi:EF-hand domain-containing protein [Caulobacter sp. UC70_42]|uniref:EF-hand domain-containing protein n=1 Tax=Caulobacter sp. UC70_42 TaxID=3374551 RepID=UPI003757FCC0